MDCSICKKRIDDVDLSCAICLESFHAKCIGIKGRDAEKIVAIPGLCYYCDKHRKMSTDVLHWKFIKLQKAFKRVVAIFSELQDIFDFDSSDVEKMSEGFVNIDRLLQQPNHVLIEQQKLVEDKRLQELNDQRLKLQLLQDQLDKISIYQATPHQKQKDPQLEQHIQEQPQLAIELVPPLLQNEVQTEQQQLIDVTSPQLQIQHPKKKNCRKLRSNTINQVIVPAINVVPDNSPNGASTSALTPIGPSPERGQSTTDPDTATSNDNVQTSTDPGVNCTLRVVPPPFVVFVSRLQYGTKPSDIIDYILKKGVDTNYIRCHSLTADNLTGRFSASFKIIAPLTIGKMLANPTFWPSNMIVKEFTNRPSTKKSNSKNIMKQPSSIKM